jgi:3-phenylpropionate/cinnamic acid dioxygenase small subunit
MRNKRNREQLRGGSFAAIAPASGQCDSAPVTEDERRAAEADIAKLIYRYARANDAHDWHALAEMFTPDGRLARPVSPDTFVEGRVAILASFVARPARASRHVVSNVTVEMKDAETASAFSVIVLYLGEAQAPLVGFFDDRLVRIAGAWQFAERRGGLDFGA